MSSSNCGFEGGQFVASIGKCNFARQSFSLDFKYRDFVDQFSP
jgi:hypothetical protein